MNRSALRWAFFCLTCLVPAISAAEGITVKGITLGSLTSVEQIRQQFGPAVCDDDPVQRDCYGTTTYMGTSAKFIVTLVSGNRVKEVILNLLDTDAMDSIRQELERKYGPPQKTETHEKTSHVIAYYFPDKADTSVALIYDAETMTWSLSFLYYGTPKINPKDS